MLYPVGAMRPQARQRAFATSSPTVFGGFGRARTSAIRIRPDRPHSQSTQTVCFAIVVSVVPPELSFGRTVSPLLNVRQNLSSA